ncbi:hypothetical protein GCM10011609_61830 [Lentzea pudingi]|uniref:ScoMcrA-like N-terminal head domain-containing protein n=1 Tax=Lentzea pudingi TaxID=1789439 RepID=A0ABQ2IK97_9PSEU|nr:hypothetical protein [Lentzea pudingi]GGN13063.1 hypothetical protein GCM10011609_61830 [Lentzea pudingi]
MGLGDITADAVHAAMAEHDRMGMAEFCERYGFDLSRNYVITDGGQRRGTRVIAAAAHGHLPGRSALKPLEVADDALVNQTLEGLQFKVKKLSPPTWSRDELILACSQLFSNDRVAQRVNDPAVQELAAFLRRLPIHAQQDRGLNFRSVSSVQRKLFDLMTRLPGYTGKKTRGGAQDQVIVGEFLADEAEMHRLAAEIRAAHDAKAWAVFTANVPGSSYVHDGAAGNPEQLREGHVIVLYDDENVLGFGRISRIERNTDVTAQAKHVLHYGGTWRPLDGAIGIDDLDEACTREASPDGIRALDAGKLEAMLARIAVPLSSQEAETRAVAKIEAMRRIVIARRLPLAARVGRLPRADVVKPRRWSATDRAGSGRT